MTDCYVCGESVDAQEGCEFAMTAVGEDRADVVATLCEEHAILVENALEGKLDV